MFKRGDELDTAEETPTFEEWLKEDTNKKDEKFYLFIDEVQFTDKVIDKENGGIVVSIYDMLNELSKCK